MFTGALQDMVKSSDDFDNGCIPTHYDARVVGLF